MQTGLPTEYFALCSGHFEASFSAEVCLLGHQWVSRGFTLRKVKYHQHTQSRKIHWTLITQEMREDLQIDFSLETFFGRFFGPPPSLPRNVSIKNPFLSDWVGLFEICFRSSEMTDPRPCSRGWACSGVPLCSTKTCQFKPTTNYKLQKSIYFRGQRNITVQNTPSQMSKGRFSGTKSICPE